MPVVAGVAVVAGGASIILSILGLLVTLLLARTVVQRLREAQR
jgi:hypothetical protein